MSNTLIDNIIHTVSNATRNLPGKPIDRVRRARDMTVALERALSPAALSTIAERHGWRSHSTALDAVRRGRRDPMYPELLTRLQTYRPHSAPDLRLNGRILALVGEDDNRRLLELAERLGVDHQADGWAGLVIEKVHSRIVCELAG